MIQTNIIVLFWFLLIVSSCKLISSNHTNDDRSAAVPGQGVKRDISKGPDAGNSWRKMLVSENAFLSIVFLNSQFGIATGTEQRYCITLDGGNQWIQKTIQLASSQSRAYGDVFKYDLVYSAVTPAGNIFLIGHIESSGSAIFYSPDKGRTWKVDYYDNASFDDICAVGEKVWILGEIYNEVNGIAPGIVLLNKDHHNEWKVIWRGKDDQPLNSVFFLDETHGWLVGPKGLIMRSGNGGHSWIRQTSPINETLVKVAFSDLSHGYAIGPRGVILSTLDGGLKWEKQISNTDADLRNIVVPKNSKEAWVLGEKGTVLFTSDGGKTWKIQNYTYVASEYNMAITVVNGSVWIATMDGNIFTIP
ncbi:MAG: hypothetical protein IPM66_19350 [Acidobacteriota bacterium]|nr:MAG: hypothetical protein IPM66_19350 [Acidobacteriota bacterium]